MGTESHDGIGFHTTRGLTTMRKRLVLTWPTRPIAEKEHVLAQIESDQVVCQCSRTTTFAVSSICSAYTDPSQRASNSLLTSTSCSSTRIDDSTKRSDSVRATATLANTDKLKAQCLKSRPLSRRFAPAVLKLLRRQRPRYIQR